MNRCAVRREWCIGQERECETLQCAQKNGTIETTPTHTYASHLSSFRRMLTHSRHSLTHILTLSVSPTHVTHSLTHVLTLSVLLTHSHPHPLSVTHSRHPLSVTHALNHSPFVQRPPFPWLCRRIKWYVCHRPARISLRCTSHPFGWRTG
jgi:hypothetical protein